MKKKNYTREFRQEAAKLVLERGMTTTEAAKDLGVAWGSVAKWVRDYREHGNNAFPGKGRLMPHDEELRRLQRENQKLKIERDILKKTIGFLAEKP